MDKVIDKTIELHDKIQKEPLFEEYFRLKSLFENDDQLAEYRRAIAKAKAGNDTKTYDKLKRLYDNNPLVVNYYNYLDEVKEYLEEIKEILS